MSQEIRVILCDTRHAGNIGAVARLMKNLDLTDLALVNPTGRGLIEAVKMAVGAEEIIEQAEVVDTLEEALAPCARSFAATRRTRKSRKLSFDPGSAATFIEDQEGITGYVYGSEKFGLTNDQVALCTALLSIPVSEAHPSYNLAQAAAITLYPAALPSLNAPKRGKKSYRIPSDNAERRLLYERIVATARQAGFFGLPHDKKTIAAIEDIFERASLDKKDVAILQGLFKQLGRAAGRDE